MRLIGLTGSAGAGKDAAARFMRDTQCFVQLAFADPLRDGLKAMFGLTDDQLSDRSLKERPIDWLGRSPRELMQTLGTEWGRTFVAPDVWLRTAQRRIEHCRKNARDLHISGVVISDVRFRNEAQWIRAQGGEVWRLVRPSAGLAGRTAGHISEHGNIEPDVTIPNTGTLDDLYENIAARLACLHC